MSGRFANVRQDAAQLKQLSRFISKVLRHEPELLDLEPEPGGWVMVDELLGALMRRGYSVSRADLDYLVTTSDKQRFSFEETGCRIRANQGHSIDIDLQLEPVQPPTTLFHGTHEGAKDSILTGGLKKMDRHHVHLSADTDTARLVGQRRGKPVIFEVDAQAMAQTGVTFYCSKNGVWLTDFVAAEFLRLVPG
ncbi:MAG TPA: RNA 2'-phosphotransferase [Fimbriimonas sp.]|nr:RNA 2'-phosphotransferase [Fimbriimonas sp.]